VGIGEGLGMMPQAQEKSVRLKRSTCTEMKVLFPFLNKKQPEKQVFSV
jgi:hypothetical protein